MESHGYIKQNYEGLLREIKELSSKAETEVTLVAVTKSGTDEELLALARCGVTDIGENRPQELARRGALLEQSGYSPRLHEIGNLQRNKVKLIIDKTDLIHSVDSIPLAEEINRQAEIKGIKVKILMEINCAEEEKKGGILPNEAESFYLALKELPNILVCGIMTMGPVVDDPEDIRPYFKLTKEIFDKIKNKYGYSGEGVLSMGMSDSYAVAIEEGATLVRVGRRLFEKKGNRENV